MTRIGMPLKRRLLICAAAAKILRAYRERLPEEAEMVTSVTGVYRNGQVILTEQPQNLPEEAQVIITFLIPSVLDLAAQGIDEAHAADLRARLRTFASEWDQPEMDIYSQ
jgi:hypothetical protein